MSTVMLFYFRKAPVTFLKLIERIFVDIIFVDVIVYLDNVLLFSFKPTSLVYTIREVLQLLIEAKLLCKATK